MNPTFLKVARRLLIALAFGALSVGILVMSPRLFSLPFLAASFIAAAFWVYKIKWQWPFFLWVTFLLVSLSPIDIRPTSWIGHPKLQRVVMGLPTKNAIQASERGEIWLGGCIVSLNDPKWVITW